MEELLRLSTAQDLPALHQVWKDVFSSPDEDLFFDHFYKPDRCVVAEAGGIVCAMGFILPAGQFVYGDTSYPCAMIYALATMPGYRNRGIGSAIVSKLVSQGRKAGYPVTILCPSSDDVFEYYSAKTDFSESFYITERKFSHITSNSKNTQSQELSAKDYMKLRNKKLPVTAHIQSDLNIITYQKKLCDLSGGGLYKVCGIDWTAIASVEKLNDKKIIINELLCPPEYENDALFAISEIFPGCEIVVRTPVSPNLASKINIKRFGMMTSSLTSISNIYLGDAWYGFAFD